MFLFNFKVSYRQWNSNLNSEISTREYDITSLKWENKNRHDLLDFLIIVLFVI